MLRAIMVRNCSGWRLYQDAPEPSADDTIAESSWDSRHQRASMAGTTASGCSRAPGRTPCTWRIPAVAAVAKAPRSDVGALGFLPRRGGLTLLTCGNLETSLVILASSKSARRARISG